MSSNFLLNQYFNIQLTQQLQEEKKTKSKFNTKNSCFSMK